MGRIYIHYLILIAYGLRLSGGNMTHEEKVLQIASQLKERRGNIAVKLEKGIVSHFVPNPYDKRDKLPKVNISSLCEVIEIDKENRTCICEPGVTFSDLVRETLKSGLIPYTVPELKGITVGGAVSGCSIESMSYKFGGFHDSALEYELITGRGDIITVSELNGKLLFDMVHGSYGTLGIISKAKFKLFPAKPYVQMTYKSFSEFKEFWDFLQTQMEKTDYEFIDAIIHGPEKMVVCLGKFKDSAPYVSRYDWLGIYYKSTAVKEQDYLSTYDYLFRYDTECHWLTKTVPLMETKPARLIAGKFVLGSTNLIKWSKRLKSVMKIKRRPEVVVDVFIPHTQFEEFFEWYKSDYQFYPLWIVPYRSPEVYPWIGSEYGKKMGSNIFIDCAVYGKVNNDPDIDYSELLEKKTVELGGIKTLISRNHFDEETFWKVYNRENYEKAKEQLDPDRLFGDLYEKFRPERYSQE